MSDSETAPQACSGSSEGRGLDALVIGAGVAGLYQLYLLREQGLKVLACDTASGVGDNPIQRVTPKGIETADGTLHKLDVIILATGFDAGTGALTRIDIRGRGGRSLAEDWGRDIRTTLGLQVHGYPNLFTTAAALAPSAALCNMTTCLQQQAEWISDCIEHLRERNYTVIEPTREMEDRWVAHHDETANATLIARTDSWYVGANVAGKPRRVLSYTGGVGAYRLKCDDVAARALPCASRSAPGRRRAHRQLARISGRQTYEQRFQDGGRWHSAQAGDLRCAGAGSRRHGDGPPAQPLHGRRRCAPLGR